MEEGSVGPRPLAADRSEIVAEALRVLRAEARAVQALGERLDDDFVRACTLVAGAGGRVVVSGIGKSGIVGRKLAATLTSTGTPATFLHPVEGLHGDMGIVGREDVAVLISKSGDAAELEGLTAYLVRLGVPIVAMTGSTRSPLSRHAAAVLDCSVKEEACPWDLAPTSYHTASTRKNSKSRRSWNLPNKPPSRKGRVTQTKNWDMRRRDR